MADPDQVSINNSDIHTSANLSYCQEQQTKMTKEEFSKICDSYLADTNDKYSSKPATQYLMEPHQILALVLSSIAIALNILSLLAIAKIRNRMSTHLRLIASLCMSDLVIAISLCLHVLNAELNPYPGLAGSHNERMWTMCAYMIVKALNSTGLTMCLLNLTMMAVDHFMAISRPLHYNVRMRSAKIALILGILWTLASLGGFSDFFTGLNTYYYQQGNNYCEAVYLSLHNDEYIVLCVFCVTLVLMIAIYSLIYKKIHMHQTPGEESKRSSRRKRTISERRRNKQALITTLLILGTFLLCWTPISIYQIALITQVNISVKPLQSIAHILIIIDRYLYDLMLLNSIADPIIYAVRMYDVQIGYRRLFHMCKPLPKQNTDITSRGDLPWHLSTSAPKRQNVC